MDEKTVSVKVKLSVEDYCEIQNQHMRNTLIALCVLLPLILFGIIALFGKTNISPLYSFPIYGFLVVCLLLSLPRSQKKSWIQQYESNKIMQKEQTFLIKTDGIEISSDISTTQLFLQDLHAFRETKNAFYVYLSSVQFHYIPKKCFDGNEEGINFAKECLSSLPVYPVTKPIYIGTKKDKKPAKTSPAFYIILISFVVILVFAFIFFSR